MMKKNLLLLSDCLKSDVKVQHLNLTSKCFYKFYFTNNKNALIINYLNFKIIYFFCFITKQ